MNPEEVTQGGAAWMQYRLAKCTGSRVKDALSFLKNGLPSQKRIDYMVQLIAERMTGSAAEHYVSPEMRFGQEMEPLARSAYEQRTGLDVDLIGISQHPSIGAFCASLDGTVGQDGGVEFKCAKTSTHISWALDGEAPKMPEEHALQVYAEMACSGRQWIDFCSFDPRLERRYQLMIVRIHRDEQMIAMVDDGVRRFLADMDAMVERLNERFPPIAEPEPPAQEHPDEYLGDAEFEDECFHAERVDSWSKRMLAK